MRVLEVSHFLAFKLYRRKLAALHDRHGFQVMACIPRGWREDFIGIRGEEADAGDGYKLVARHALLNWRIWGPKRFHLFVLSPLVAADLKRFQPDIVAVDAEPYSLLALEMALLRRLIVPRAKLVVHSSQSLLKRFPPPFRQFERFVLTQADAACVRTEEIAAVLRAKGMRRPIHIVPHGVDVNLFTLDARRDTNGTAALRIGYLGALHRQKGVDVLLRAVALMHGSRVLEIVGDGPERERLRALVRDLGIGDVVQFRGSVPHAATPAVIPMWDVLVLPSRTTRNVKEQFGRVLIEAMASGVPVVGSSSGEIPEVIGPAGRVFPENDAPALARVLDELAARPELRASLSEQARRRAVDQYSWEAVADRVAKVYRELVCESLSWPMEHTPTSKGA